ncbi:hypothetical protein SAMN05443572_12025 [Myxococcus fulvus]|uniref:Uncharacterized protein n=1 Tax=Myxococcus fulvus TaxID=33 RepID=A0A511TGT3_MYXFU|nr:hypothetical protein [Myxococcus fulvus]GEN13389.1 hypothetical protein MFU01_84260 [Myxococcus fulvus]SEU42669.1 hypothetical protein SAMN05443572_12025 [Myxococcus fulvus]
MIDTLTVKVRQQHGPYAPVGGSLIVEEGQSLLLDVTFPEVTDINRQTLFVNDAGMEASGVYLRREGDYAFVASNKSGVVKVTFTWTGHAQPLEKTPVPKDVTICILPKGSLQLGSYKTDLRHLLIRGPDENVYFLSAGGSEWPRKPLTSWSEALRFNAPSLPFLSEFVDSGVLETNLPFTLKDSEGRNHTFHWLDVPNLRALLKKDTAGYDTLLVAGPDHQYYAFEKDGVWPTTPVSLGTLEIPRIVVRANVDGPQKKYFLVGLPALMKLIQPTAPHQPRRVIFSKPVFRITEYTEYFELAPRDMSGTGLTRPNFFTQPSAPPQVKYLSTFGSDVTSPGIFFLNIETFMASVARWNDRDEFRDVLLRVHSEMGPNRDVFYDFNQLNLNQSIDKARVSEGQLEQQLTGFFIRKGAVIGNLTDFSHAARASAAVGADVGGELISCYLLDLRVLRGDT